MESMSRYHHPTQHMESRVVSDIIINYHSSFSQHPATSHNKSQRTAWDWTPGYDERTHLKLRRLTRATCSISPGHLSRYHLKLFAPAPAPAPAQSCVIISRDDVVASDPSQEAESGSNPLHQSLLSVSPVHGDTRTQFWNNIWNYKASL